MQDRQVEAEGLAAGRAGRDNRVAVAHHALPGVGLVGVERVDADAGERVADVRVQLLRDLRANDVVCALVRGGDQALLLAGEQALERGCPRDTLG